MSKFERELEERCHQAANELGLTGTFERCAGKHHAYRIVLPDNSVVKFPVACTPRMPTQYLNTIKKRMSTFLFDRLEMRGAA